RLGPCSRFTTPNDLLLYKSHPKCALNINLVRQVYADFEQTVTMRPSLLPTTLLASTTLAAPYARIKNGLILGSTSNGVDTFLGIPYADPPVGNLRLRRPQSLSKPLGTF